MKKIKLYSLILLCLAVFIGTSCSKDSEDIASGIVYYPVFIVDGSDINYVALGDDFTVPDVKVMDGSTDITASATIEGEIDLSTPGVYEKVITATTADGYTESKTIMVFVYHPDYKSAEIAGDYNGVLFGVGGGPVTIKQVEKGIYILDDFFAGYYSTYKEYRAKYGNAYDAGGYLIYVGGNNFIASNINTAWGPATIVGEISYEPESGTISYILDQGGYTWGDRDFVLTPVVE
ncbi:DUF5012 domain-containing protein [Labilibaculum sp. K2S]|uniref:BT_2262 family domain-containing protein n=1 Tax=Labilibaculum sp. K2S TaxID=3056386 RepID=UPI0025A3A97B|nr:BT_2262 family domain-containing protein [Labilibaculum sp. K2S]MDM8158825.1 DUF5012 domain-containing protein [Labilibaculum sp. K2S]